VNFEDPLFESLLVYQLPWPGGDRRGVRVRSEETHFEIYLNSLFVVDLNR
jgi:hypothetical protein